LFLYLYVRALKISLFLLCNGDKTRIFIYDGIFHVIKLGGWTVLSVIIKNTEGPNV